MEYFRDQDFSMDQPSDREISPAERAFLKKYLGVDDPSALRGPAPVEGRPVTDMIPGKAPAGDCSPAFPAAPHAPDPAPLPAATPDPGAKTPAPAIKAPVPDVFSPAETPAVSVDEMLRGQETATLVGFRISKEIFVIPIDSVLEVIHYEKPFKLPMAPSYLPGVVNLRGRILPVVDLAKLLILEDSRVVPTSQNRLIIVCEAKNLRIGLLADGLHTIFKAEQNNLNWNAEAHLGSSAELLSGLLETGEKLLGIVSVERLADKLLEE